MPPCAAWSLSPPLPTQRSCGLLWSMHSHSCSLALVCLVLGERDGETFRNALSALGMWGCGDALEGRDLLYKWFTLKV